MIVGDLLDELRVGILRDSSTLKNGPPDQYWTDARLMTYIDDAHKRFTRLSLCIHDDTTPLVTQVTLSSTVDVYQLNPAVLAVLSARHQDDQFDMARLNHRIAMTLQNQFTETFEFAIVPTPGKPYQFTTDEGMDPKKNHAIRIRFLGVPDASQDGKIVYLRTIRQPITSLTLDDLDAQPEIPEEYQLDMLEWAAYRALRNWDVDGEDREKANTHRDRFAAAVAECKKDVQRKTWAPLLWGFGQNGFSYVKN
jgi:hypothetical protein